jgi:hypothetical protein
MLQFDATGSLVTGFATSGRKLFEATASYASKNWHMTHYKGVRGEEVATHRTTRFREVIPVVENWRDAWHDHYHYGREVLIDGSCDHMEGDESEGVQYKYSVTGGTMKAYYRPLPGRGSSIWTQTHTCWSNGVTFTRRVGDDAKIARVGIVEVPDSHLAFDSDQKLDCIVRHDKVFPVRCSDRNVLHQLRVEMIRTIRTNCPVPSLWELERTLDVRQQFADIFRRVVMHGPNYTVEDFDRYDMPRRIPNIPRHILEATSSAARPHGIRIVAGSKYLYFATHLGRIVASAPNDWNVSTADWRVMHYCGGYGEEAISHFTDHDGGIHVPRVESDFFFWCQEEREELCKANKEYALPRAFSSVGSVGDVTHFEEDRSYHVSPYGVVTEYSMDGQTLQQAWHTGALIGYRNNMPCSVKVLSSAGEIHFHADRVVFYGKYDLETECSGLPPDSIAAVLRDVGERAINSRHHITEVLEEYCQTAERKISDAIAADVLAKEAAACQLQDVEKRRERNSARKSKQKERKESKRDAKLAKQDAKTRATAMALEKTARDHADARLAAALDCAKREWEEGRGNQAIDRLDKAMRLHHRNASPAAKEAIKQAQREWGARPALNTTADGEEDAPADVAVRDATLVAEPPDPEGRGGRGIVPAHGGLSDAGGDGAVTTGPETTEAADRDLSVPEEVCCSITMEPMFEAVTCVPCGHTFSKTGMHSYLTHPSSVTSSCPTCRKHIDRLVTAFAVQAIAAKYK